jgi:hypothetical protein
MSQAFMREKEEDWLGDVDPTVPALARYLTKENNGIRVYEMKCYIEPKLKTEVHEMSNGSCYALDFDKRWYMV